MWYHPPGHHAKKTGILAGIWTEKYVLVPFLFSDPYLQLFPLCNGHHKLANRCARITDEDIYSYCSSCSLHYFHSKAALFNAGCKRKWSRVDQNNILPNAQGCPGGGEVMVDSVNFNTVVRNRTGSANPYCSLETSNRWYFLYSKYVAYSIIWYDLIPAITISITKLILQIAISAERSLSASG